MKKIVYIGNNLSKDDKYTPTLVTLSNFLKSEGFIIKIASSKQNKIVRVLDMLFTVLKHFKSSNYVLIDTYGAFNFYYAVLISQLCRLLNQPYIPILHGGNLPVRFENNPYWTRLLFKYSFFNSTPSEFLKTELGKHGFTAKVIPNIIDIKDYKFKLRSSFDPKILYVRAFHQIYNPTMAVRVLYQVKQLYPKATLCMIGPPMDTSFDETKALAKELNIEDSITYTGVLSKKEWHKVSEDYDIFINTTTIDNTPVSVMEAMAMGLPVVTTNVGGIPYLLEDKKDAFLVNSNDVQAMAFTIIKIIEGTTDVTKVMYNARKKVEQFDWSVVRESWLNLLENTPTKKPLVDRLYNQSPVFLQNILISVYGIYWKNRRLGGKFKKYLKQFKSRENYSKQEWLNYQTVELRKLLVHAFTTVPFYKALYSKQGFTLKDFENFELKDLQKLPYLEKEDLREFGKTTLLSTKKNKGAFYDSSGSTGTPVSIYLSKTMHQKWNAAYESRIRNWAGVDSNTARGMIGGRRIIDNNQPIKPFYRYNSAEKQTYFSAYFINEQNTPNYIEGMYKHGIEYMVGYAMSNFFLAENINKNNLKAPQLKAVLTSSEQLTPEMRIAIEKAYQCKVYDAYSGVEACGLISENTGGELLFSPDTGIMEVVDEQGQSVENGEVGEVIATGLLNFDQPLIRYRIGDRVRMSKNQKSISKIEMPVVAEIEGRIEDIIIAKNGSKMVRFHGVFIDIPNVVVGQIIQLSLNKIQINLVVTTEFDVKNENIMSARLKSQLGDVQVSFDYLEEIPKNNNGKFQAVISHVKKLYASKES